MENRFAYTNPPADDFIFVTEGKNEIKLYLNEVSHCSAERKGTWFYKVWLDKTKPQQRYFMTRNIGFYFARLFRAGFLRHHDSYMSNTLHFVNIDTDNKYTVELTGGIFVRTSLGRKCILIDYLNLRKG